jgi:hypothetical protein
MLYQLSYVCVLPILAAPDRDERETRRKSSATRESPYQRTSRRLGGDHAASPTGTDGLFHSTTASEPTPPARCGHPQRGRLILLGFQVRR